MKKKNQTSDKKSFKKQLISGGVYIALSAVAVAVTVNTAISMLSPDISVPNLDNTNLKDFTTPLPTVPENIVLPKLDTELFSTPIQNKAESTTVSDLPSGVSAEVTQDFSLITEEASLQNSVSDEPNESILTEISAEIDISGDSFVKPCDGFITVEHSVDIPVYSPTLSDYRTHNGIDIAADKNAVVVSAKGGIITKIYSDDLYGHSLQLDTPDGFTMIYSNLSMPLSDGIQEGLAVSAGTVLGSIGESAIIEASQESHLHFELYKDSLPVNPAEYIDF